MAKKQRKRNTDYSSEGAGVIPAPTPNPLVLQAVDNYIRAHPRVPDVDRGNDVSALDRPKLVQPNVQRRVLQTAGDTKHFFQLGNYLGSITVDEGELIGLTLEE